MLWSDKGLREYLPSNEEKKLFEKRRALPPEETPTRRVARNVYGNAMRCDDGF